MTGKITYLHTWVVIKCIEEKGNYTILTKCGEYHVTEIGCDAQLISAELHIHPIVSWPSKTI